MSRPFSMFSLYSLPRAIPTRIIWIKITIIGLIVLSSMVPMKGAWAVQQSSQTVAWAQSLGGLSFAKLPLFERSAMQPASKRDPTLYVYRDRPSSDGIGKMYLGREIAQVMGHQGAAWLERPSRIQEEKPHVLLADLDIQPTDTIADIGAGTGYLTVRLASKVPQGKVIAVDLQPEMLDLLSQRLVADKVDNVDLILASEENPHLPTESVDMAIMLDVYHELAYPYEVMRAVVRSLRPGGQMVLVEYRGENPLVPIKRLHKMTERQVKKELKAVGLQWVETKDDLPRQHLMVFQKALS